MAIIKVPKTPATAFNPRRKPSDLIRQQIKHLEWALLPAAQRQPTRLKSGTVKTEAQAAAYIALLTERVQQAYADYQKRVALGLPRDVGPAPDVRLPNVPTVKIAAPPRKKAGRKPRKAAGAAKGPSAARNTRRAPAKSRRRSR
jgi:hypothetical protein